MSENKAAGFAILVVDDCEDIRLMLRAMLEMRGHCVLEAEDGQAAIELARRACPDLILMDLNMPVLGGLDATRRLRELEALRHTPIVAVSANPKDRCHAEALAAGCNEYLAKPVIFSQLDHLLGRFLAV